VPTVSMASPKRCLPRARCLRPRRKRRRDTWLRRRSKASPDGGVVLQTRQVTSLWGRLLPRDSFLLLYPTVYYRCCWLFVRCRHDVMRVCTEEALRSRTWCRPDLESCGAIGYRGVRDCATDASEESISCALACGGDPKDPDKVQYCLTVDLTDEVRSTSSLPLFLVFPHSMSGAWRAGGGYKRVFDFFGIILGSRPFLVYNIIKPCLGF